MPPLMLLVVEVMTVWSRPVCSLSTADRAVMSPDNTAVFTFSNPSGLCTALIKVVMVELSSFKPSRMVVSTVFESPPSSPERLERPSWERMLPLCWSKRAPTCLADDDQADSFFFFCQSYNFASLKGYIVAL